MKLRIENRVPSGRIEHVRLADAFSILGIVSLGQAAFALHFLPPQRAKNEVRQNGKYLAAVRPELVEGQA
jgi:hypothetical protein